MKTILIVLLLLINLNAESFYSDKKEENSASYILALKDLILATQKTRGLTNSYLHGNSNVLPIIKKHQDEMKQAIGKLETSPLIADPTIEFYTITISRELPLLNETALTMDPDKAFLSYTDEIGKLIEWAKIISHRAKITHNQLGQDVTVLLTQIILPMIEDVAQMRGIGSGIVAKGKINIEEREKLLALSMKINMLQEELDMRMQNILTTYSRAYNDDTYKAVEYISNKIEKYMNITGKTLVNTPGSVDSELYFQQGTDIINMLLKLHKINNRASFHL